MAGGAHVGVDTAVSIVGTPAHLGGFVDLDVLDHQRIHIKTLYHTKQRKIQHIRPGTENILPNRILVLGKHI